MGSRLKSEKGEIAKALLVLPDGYTWAADEQLTPQDTERLRRAEAKRERKRAKRLAR
jgi:hypothetical protein